MNEQNEQIKEANKLSRFFEIEITLRIFGQAIAHWIFPPKRDK